MNLLITGAEGFVGKNLSKDLAQGRFAILSPTREELDLTDAPAVQTFFSKNEIDVVIHSATTLRDGFSYPPDTCESNLKMFFNLQRFKKKNTKLINIGSGSEYSRTHWHGKMSEDFFDENIPVDSHSYAKYLISKYIQDASDESLVSIRLFGIYGKYEDYRYKFISNAIVKNILKQPIVINQNVLYDYICVSDLSRLLLRLIEQPLRHRSYNMTPAQPIDLITIANLINEVSDFKSNVVTLNPGVGVEYTGNNERLMREIGEFQFEDPKISIEKLRNYYLEITASLDVQAIMADDYLNYAKELREKYFLVGNDK
jgi:UDP-glucose 4-epimerase